MNQPTAQQHQADLSTLFIDIDAIAAKVGSDQGLGEDLNAMRRKLAAIVNSQAVTEPILAGYLEDIQAAAQQLGSEAVAVAFHTEDTSDEALHRYAMACEHNAQMVYRFLSVKARAGETRNE